MTDDLARFYRYKQIPLDRPRYRRVEKLPFVPLESEIDQPIAGLGYLAFFSFSGENDARVRSID